jgi:hypothetical protein
MKAGSGVKAGAGMKAGSGVKAGSDLVAGAVVAAALVAVIWFLLLSPQRGVWPGLALDRLVCFNEGHE